MINMENKWYYILSTVVALSGYVIGSYYFKVKTDPVTGEVEVAKRVEKPKKTFDLDRLSDLKVDTIEDTGFDPEWKSSITPIETQ